MLLHRALERLWQQLEGSAGLAARPDAALEPLIERCVREAAVEILGSAEDELALRASAREIRRAVRLIGELCALERERAPFVVRAVELGRRIEVDGARLDVRIDRLDETADGALVIIDYKSGRAETQRWLEEPVSHPQLLGYLLAVGRDVAAIAIAHVARTGVGFRGVAARGDLLPRVGPGPRGAPAPDAEHWAGQLEAWRDIARRLIAQFVAGEAAVAPAAKACDYCHLHGLCRIGERAPGDDGEDEEGSDD
jgi:RecB family exonuclease